MIPETGRRFGPYEIQGRLGGGGMGHVFRAWDARLHREVAIKLLHNEFAMPGMRERFLREARAASALNHPNICTVFDIGEQDGDPYLVMELLEGETLKDRIQRSTIQSDDISCIAREIAEALSAAHAKGVIHRDVKPANIFLVDKPNGKVQAKVLDFGLAKIEGGALGSLGARSRSVDITSAGATVGTLAYMSPEQARGESLDSRSDLFSLGVVLYEMATRQVPFQGATSALIFVKLLNHPPEPVRDWNESIPRDLERIILKLMAKERTARFQTANELDEALARLGDKGNAGGWLRKAVSTVPLVRAPDPIARERRSARRRGSDSQHDSSREPNAPSNVQPGASPDNAARSPSSGSNQVLRPVTRLPRGDATPRSLEDRRDSSGVPIRRPSTGSRERYNPEPPVTFETSRPAVEPPIPAPVPPTPAAEQFLRPRVPIDLAPDPQPVLAPTPALTPIPAPAPEFTPNAPHPALQADSGVIDTPDFPPLADAPSRRRPKPLSRQIVIAMASAVVLAIAVVLFINRGHFGPTLLSARDRVVLTEIINNTGARSLDHSVAAGLQLALAQSPYLRLSTSEAFHASTRILGIEASTPLNAIQARTAAQRLGAKAYLFGSISGTSAPYKLHIDLLNAETNDVLASLDEQAGSLGEVPGAIDRMSDDIRASIGEDTDSISNTHVPLAAEATANLDALHAFSAAETALAAGRQVDALRLYQQAATLEPRFVQAQLRLVTLYRLQRAEAAASDAARAALTASEKASARTRTLAQFEYEMNSSGDFTRATALIRGLLAQTPHDSAALAGLARVLMVGGHLAEALQSAQEAYTEDPYNLEAYLQAENCLIGLDRYDAALQLGEQVGHLGLIRTGASVISAYLEGRGEPAATPVAEYTGPRHSLAGDPNSALILDNSGRLADGLSTWRENAIAADAVDGLDSAAASFLAQGALDRALLGDCARAVPMADEAAKRSQGLNALFNTGMAQALCGAVDDAEEAATDMQRLFPQSTEANDYLLPDLKAAILLQKDDPAAALEVLRPARQFDLISLTPFLRGRAHVALRQVQIGIVDFQTVLSHRGINFVTGTDVYPMAQIGVARAFADTGDRGNSADAYRRFLELWRHADPGQPLLLEAVARSRDTRPASPDSR